MGKSLYKTILKRGICICLCTLFSFVHLNASAQIYVGHPDYIVYSYEDYINSNQIFHVEKGPRGLIYMANITGIQEYDGKEWRLITENTKGIVRSFEIDYKTGIIYYGIPGEIGYLKPNTHGGWEYHSINKEVNKSLGKFSDVWNVRLINNDVYFLTYNKLFKYNIDTKEIEIWESDTFFSLSGVIDGQIYVGQNEKGLYSVVDDSLMLLSDEGKLKTMLFYNIIPYNKTHILITSTDDAVFIDKETYKPDNALDTLVEKLSPVLKNNVYYISTLKNNRFCITTLYNGIYILDSLLNIQSIYNKEDGLPTNLSWYATETNSGIIWAALDNGLAKIHSEKHFIFFDKNQYLNNRLMSLLKYKNILYLGTSEGLYKLNIANINALFLEETDIKAPIWDIIKYKTEDGDTAILMASSEGIWEYKDNKSKLLVEQSGVSDVIRSNIYQNRIYYSYNRGVSYIEDKGKTWSEPVNVTDVKMGSKLIEDSIGHLWLFTSMQDAYLITKNNNDFTTKEIVIDTSGVNIFDAFLLKNSMILTTSKGFYKFNNKEQYFQRDSVLFEFKNKDLKAGQTFKVSDNEIWLSAFDDQMSFLLHFFREDSVFKMGHKQNPFFKYKTISKIYSESDDHIWLSLDGKLLLIKNLNKFSEDTCDFNALIRKVSINNDSVIFHGTNFFESKDGIIMNFEGQTVEKTPVDYYYNNISFEFTAPFFEKEWLNQFSFILEGYDDSWSEWSSEYKKEYTNLREGTYTFKVKARNIYNKESKQYTYTFTIKPPYYRSIYAYLIYILLTISLVGFGIRYFRHKHKREKYKLENIITQRTSEIRSQKEKIENQAKLLGNANQQLHKLSIVASKVDNPVVICDINGKIEWVNESYCKYFNKEQKEMINSNYNLLDICFNPNVKKYFDTCIKEKRPITYTINASEVRINKELWMQTTLTPIIDHMDEVINIIAISSDITYLHELNNTRDMVISVITHDLKSPLLAFKMISGNLLKQLNKVNQVKLEKNLSELYTHSSEIYEFLQYLSEWLKSQSGSLTFFPHAFDISNTLDEVIGLFKLSANQKRIKLVNKIPESTGVFADENMIKTVLRNLISNAIKFSKVGDIVTIYSSNKEKEIVISVSDNGIGIDKDKRDKIFTLNESSGLGLIISKEFVQKNKGDIWLEDKEKGALINFSVPSC